MNDLAHPRVSEFTHDVAKTLKLDKAFVEFVLNPSRPACFSYRCAPAANGWTCFVPDDAEVAHPLWSCNANQTLIFVSQGTVLYAKGSHESPTIDPIARTPQGLLADLFIDLYEDETELTELEAAADFAGFRFLGDCIEFQTANGANAIQWESLLADFIAAIDRR